ncbi:hypothetical protein TNCV_3592331 [Trichonephila clavipes]|nr:hypothetical protein TNCV_3592331 [Trichonephila clavipes]
MATSPISTSASLPWDWRGEKYSPFPCTRDSAHKTLVLTDLTSTYSVRTRRVFGGIGHRTQAFRSGVQCSNRQATHGPGSFLDPLIFYNFFLLTHFGAPVNREPRINDKGYSFAPVSNWDLNVIKMFIAV